MRILSTNVGQPVALDRPKGGQLETGHDKRPVDGIDVFDPGPKSVDNEHPSGVAGDFVGDRRHHGGTLQAVYAVGREDLDLWSGVLGRRLPNGWMGENLTTVGADLDAMRVGTRWRIGHAELRVSVPRIPCSTFKAVAARPGWLKEFTEAGGAGTYLQVLAPGRISPGDDVEVVHVPDHPVTVREYFWALTSRPDLAAHVLLAVDELPRESVEKLSGRV